ncbi:hypothetical protein PVAP13_7NG392810 [Panicum virgatum]|uniref:Uncharacterized protein n=1 Tax=Panicum virgatum TaxID=38727 RepID=A0A8T0Q3F2_PANVG|nr:hypothetical protein PVAP13_7NG392810 [Panicum virgatum]
MSRSLCCPSPPRRPRPSTTPHRRPNTKKPNPPPYTRTCGPLSAAWPIRRANSQARSRRAPTPASSSPAVRSTLGLTGSHQSVRGRVPRQDLQPSTMSLSPGIARPIIYSRVCSQASRPPASARSAGRASNARAPTRRDAVARWPERIGHATRAKLPLGEPDNYAVASALEASPPALSRVAWRLARRGDGSAVAAGREQGGEARESGGRRRLIGGFEVGLPVAAARYARTSIARAQLVGCRSRHRRRICLGQLLEELRVSDVCMAQGVCSCWFSG